MPINLKEANDALQLAFNYLEDKRTNCHELCRYEGDPRNVAVRQVFDIAQEYLKVLAKQSDTTGEGHALSCINKIRSSCSEVGDSWGKDYCDKQAALLSKPRCEVCSGTTRDTDNTACKNCKGTGCS